MYGGRMRLVNRRRSPSWSVRRSFIRGALTGIVPEPTVTFRVRPLPLRTTRAWPSASRSSRWASRYGATSVSSAVASIRRAPSRAMSSSNEPPSPAFSAASVPTTVSMGADLFARPPRRGGRSGGKIRRRGHALHDPQLPVIPRADPHHLPIPRGSLDRASSGEGRDSTGSPLTTAHRCREAVR